MPKTTKKQIITTAKELFSVYNYDSVSMNDIAQKLNISKPALYHHFANKGEIYLGAVQDVYGYFIKNFVKIIKKEFLFLLIFGTINSYALNKAMLNEEVLNKKEVINYIIKLILK